MPNEPDPMDALLDAWREERDRALEAERRVITVELGLARLLRALVGVSFTPTEELAAALAELEALV